MIGDGLSNKEMATALGISIGAVESHKTGLYAKIGSTSIAGVVKFGIRNGFISTAPRSRASTVTETEPANQ